MNTDEIARREASEILRLTLEENPRTPPHVLADRAIEAFLKVQNKVTGFRPQSR